MNHEAYTPGHTQNSTDFMSERSFESHGSFFASHIDRSHIVLDVGCGPGSISIGIARAVSSGRLHAVDFGESQINAAKARAAQAGIFNVEFTRASCYELSFEDATFDRVFCHALMEHLARPGDALREIARVLKPGGQVGVCSPDLDGTILAPTSPELTNAVDAYVDLQKSNGGDLRIGKKLGGYLCDAGFVDVLLKARYECYPSLEFIGEYLALQLDLAQMPDHAACLREWSASPIGMFAQCWVSAVGSKPNSTVQ